MRRLLTLCSLLATVLVVGTYSLAAQGVTTGAVRGVVRDANGTPIAGATLTLVNSSTGFRSTVASRDNGRYGFENVSPGGPFVVSARAIGYRPAALSEFRVALGEVKTMDFALTATTVTLDELTVTAQDNPLLSRGRTGAAVFVSDSFIDRLPNLSRNFTDLIGTSSQVNGTSVAGQNNRFNNIQIDGGVNNDLFGLGSTGTPGGQVGQRPISIEAVQEYQVLIAPFDVRQGGFTGGLINAITKSGTNELHGSLFMYGQNQSFARDSVDRGPLGTDVLETFHEYQYGGTLSGPIIRDRLQFFASVDLKRRSSPFVGYLQNDEAIDSDAFGVTQALADTVAAWSSDVLGDAGTAGQVNRDTPDNNIFVKLNAQLTDRSQLEVTFNNAKASDGSLIRRSTFSGYRDGFELGNAGYTINNTTRTLRARHNIALSDHTTNELLVGYQRIRDLRQPGMQTPLVFVGSDGAVSVGAERFSHGNQLDQDIYEVSDNFTVALGKHLVTVGTHNEFFKFYNSFFPGSWGVWGFESGTDLLAGNANHYEIALPLRPGGPAARFSVNQVGGYVQDIWTPTSKLSLTFGVRLDMPTLPTKPDANPDLAAVQFVHNNLGTPAGTDVARTSEFNTAPLWSPRFGFNYDVAGDRSTLVRGGLGVFSGRPPYVWVANAFANSGLTQATLVCNGDQAPSFVADIASQPTACAGGGEPNPPTPSINYFDPDFHFPQTMRAALGVDHRLPWGMVGTVDFLYTRAINQFAQTDINQVGVQGTATGEGDRMLYGQPGAPNGSGIASVIRPTRVSSDFGEVIRHSNASGDNSVSLSFTVAKQFSDGVGLNAGYSYSQTKDRQCMTSSVANSNLRFAVLEGDPRNRPLTTSCFDVPHKLALTGLFDLPLGVQAALTYSGSSGTPFTYTVNSDANGDGYAGNDPVYVPASASDITLRNPDDWTALDNYISSEPCLDEARGTLLKRNTCRGPWRSFLNARVTKVIPTVGGQSLEVSLDIFNLPNLLKSDWGVVKSTTRFENQAILNQTGYDVANGRGQYSLMNMSSREGVEAANSRYRLLLSGKYIF